MKLTLCSAIVLSAWSFGQFANIQLPKPKKATYIFSQVEPSICINPNDTNEVIAGSVMNDYYYSSDGGRVWKSRSIKSRSGVNGDPCVLIDTAGRYFYFHLSNVDGMPLVGGMVCQRSDVINGKFKVDTHTEVNSRFHDKQWVACDPETNKLYMTWTEFEAYDTEDSNFTSSILFSKSDNGGETWLWPKKISKVAGDCADNDKTAEGAVPAVGPSGEIYVCWSRNDTLWFTASFDDGLTWYDKEIALTRQAAGWVLDIPGLYRCNGLPVTGCDLSNGPNNGTVYVNWADQQNGVDDTDIWLMRSEDQGKTWSAPVKVNSDASGRHQFFTWMTIDQSTGFLYFIYYDRRDTKNNVTDVYLSRSTDGGQTFQDFKISQNSFSPDDGVFFGDYTNISAVHGTIRPIWMRMDLGRLSLYTAIIHDNQLK